MLLEDQPAMKTTRTLTPVMARKNKAPASTSATCMLGPNGNTPQIRMAGTKTKMGGSRKSILSAARGESSSLRISLIASATGCSKPRGPARLGP